MENQYISFSVEEAKRAKTERKIMLVIASITIFIFILGLVLTIKGITGVIRSMQCTETVTGYVRDVKVEEIDADDIFDYRYFLDKYEWTTTYSFVSKDGQICTGKQVLHKSPGLVGSPITVNYQPSDPTNNCIKGKVLKILPDQPFTEHLWFGIPILLIGLVMLVLLVEVFYDNRNRDKKQRKFSGRL